MSKRKSKRAKSKDMGDAPVVEEVDAIGEFEDIEEVEDVIEEVKPDKKSKAQAKKEAKAKARAARRTKAPKKEKKKKPRQPATAGPRLAEQVDLFTVMLGVALLAITTACLLLFLELSDYGSYPWWNAS